MVCHDKNPKHISKTPEIIFEVISPSTAKKDEGLKYSIYEAEGVRYYILIYPDDLIGKMYHLVEGNIKKLLSLMQKQYHLTISLVHSLLILI